jgi:hypothetical protein
MVFNPLLSQKHNKPTLLTILIPNTFSTQRMHEDREMIRMIYDELFSASTFLLVVVTEINIL